MATVLYKEITELWIIELLTNWEPKQRRLSFIGLMTDKGYFMMKDALEKYFEATGANKSCGNDKETILLGRLIAAQRIVIDSTIL